VDVTSAVAGNGTYTFGLSTTNSTAVSFSSREGANPPQLVVTYAAPVALGPVAPLSSDSPISPAIALLGIPLLAPSALVMRRPLTGRVLFPARRQPGSEPAF
jgi:hypothetical protein